MAENRIPSALALNESRSLSPERRASVLAENDRYERAVTALIAEGRDDGVVRDDVDPKLAAMALLGAANWLHRWYDEGRGAHADRGRPSVRGHLHAGARPRRTGRARCSTGSRARRSASPSSKAAVTRARD